MEIQLLDVIHRSQQKSTQSSPTPTDSSRSSQTPSPSIDAPPKSKRETKITNIQPKTQVASTPEVSEALAQDVVPDPPMPPSPFLSASIGKICSEWVTFVQAVGKENFSLATLLKSARPKGDEQGILVLEVYYSFHLEQLCQPKFTTLLGSLLEDTFGSKVPVKFQLSQQPAEAELIETANPELEQLAAEALL